MNLYIMMKKTILITSSFTFFSIWELNTAHCEADSDPVLRQGYRASVVGKNGMPKFVVPQGNKWNFGHGALCYFKGWQYAAYWDENRQVSVARRKLPDGPWSVLSLPGYERTENVNRGKAGPKSRGFGDGHEKVTMGISPDGIIHLAFDHHVSTLHYRSSREPIALNPEAHTWEARSFTPVQDHLGGPRIERVTYPVFTSDDQGMMLYLRLGGGSGSGNSHFLYYEAGQWCENSEATSKIIDKHWSGGNGTVNAYPHALVMKVKRWHLTWCWRDTPNDGKHDLMFNADDYVRMVRLGCPTQKLKLQGNSIDSRKTNSIMFIEDSLNIDSFRTSDSWQNQSFDKHVAIGADLIFLALQSTQNSVLYFRPRQTLL